MPRSALDEYGCYQSRESDGCIVSVLARRREASADDSRICHFFPEKKMLDEYLTLLEEAKKRDHRKIGKEMELFMFSERVGKGLPMWLPKGTALRLRLEDFLKKFKSVTVTSR